MRKVPSNKIILNKEQEAYLVENYHSKTIAEMSAHLNLKPTIMRTRAYELGLKKFEMEYWTEDQVEFLEFVFGFLGDSEIAAYFQKYLPKTKPWSKKHIEKKRRYLKLKRTNEEKRNIQKRNTMLGCFEACNRKRWEVTGITPIGTIKIWRYQNRRKFPIIRLEEGFVHYAPVLWERHNGPVPKNMVVMMLPGSPDIPEIQHLCLKSRSEMMRINAQSDTAIAKRFLGAKTNEDVQYLVNNYPELIEVKRNQIKLNGKLRELSKKTGRAKG